MPDYNTTRGCALATVTPSPICDVLYVARTILNLQANRRISKNKWTRKQQIDLAQRLNPVHTSFGLKKQANRVVQSTRVYKKVAVAKLASKQNAPLSWQMGHVFIHGDRHEAWEDVNPNIE